MVMPEAQGRGYCWGSRWGWGSGRGGDNENGGVGGEREAEMWLRLIIYKHARSVFFCVRMVTSGGRLDVPTA